MSRVNMRGVQHFNRVRACMRGMQHVNKSHANMCMCLLKGLATRMCTLLAACSVQQAHLSHLCVSHLCVSHLCVLAASSVQQLSNKRISSSTTLFKHKVFQTPDARTKATTKTRLE